MKPGIQRMLFSLCVGGVAMLFTLMLAAYLRDIYTLSRGSAIKPPVKATVTAVARPVL